MSAIDEAFIRAYEADESTRACSVIAPSPRDVPGRTARQASPGPHFQTRNEPADVVPATTERVVTAADGRRPLSAFAMPAPTVEARFKPALEVDQFRWSTACDDLVRRHSGSLRPALHALMAADEAGRSLIGFGAPASGVGCTTVLACFARMLAEAGKSIAVVDGNFASPGLASQLGLAVETGWEDVLAGNEPLAESVVYSIADRISLLPLLAGGAAAAEKLDAIHASVTAGVLRYHYDMVLFDLGSVADPVQGPIARRLATQCRLDGVVLTSGVAGATAVYAQRLMHSAPEITSICLGVVENPRHAA